MSQATPSRVLSARTAAAEVVQPVPTRVTATVRRAVPLSPHQNGASAALRSRCCEHACGAQGCLAFGVAAPPPRERPVPARHHLTTADRCTARAGPILDDAHGAREAPHGTRAAQQRGVWGAPCTKKACKEHQVAPQQLHPSDPARTKRSASPTQGTRPTHHTNGACARTAGRTPRPGGPTPRAPLWVQESVSAALGVACQEARRVLAPAGAPGTPAAAWCRKRTRVTYGPPRRPPSAGGAAGAGALDPL